MRFPERELEIVELAEHMSRGLTENAERFPAPPVTAEALEQVITEYTEARDAGQAAHAAAKERTVVKQEALTRMSSMLRSDVKYAESLANGNAGTLRLVGWAPPRRPIKNERIIPGQVITLEVNQEGPDWLTLAWKEPFDGGTVAAYRIQRRRANGGWLDVGMSVDTMVKLDHQEAGVELVYQVIGSNAAGEGPASNIVRVVL